MPISFTCPHCGNTSMVADEFAGQSGPCSACGAKITIPAFGAAQKSKSSSTGPILVIAAVVGLGGLVVCGGILVALLLPAVQAAREASRRMACTNNLKQIGLAMHNYHDVWNSFPPAYTVDENGRKLHSWRTLILPYLEQQAIYEKIDLSKPWDDPANLAVANTPIPAYRCPSHPDEINPKGATTNYMAIVGPETIMQGERVSKFRDILDGTSNTLLVVEVRGKGVCWMEPTDLDYKQMKMAIGGGNNEIHSYHPGGSNALFADGSVRFLAAAIDAATLRGLITRNGAERVVVP